jgi:hypothetical protein
MSRHRSQGVTAPEPYRDPVPVDWWQRGSADYREPLHLSYEQPGESEFGYGGGLCPRIYNGLPPSQGGVYMPKCPRVELRSPESLRPRQVRRKRGEARGYPGDMYSK